MNSDKLRKRFMGRIKMEGASGEKRLKADTETRCNRHFVGQT